MKRINRFHVAITAIILGTLLAGGATPANAADHYQGSTSVSEVFNSGNAAYAKYMGNNIDAPIGLSILKAVDWKRDGYSALAVLQKKQGGKWVEVARVIADKGVGTEMKRAVMRPQRGTELRLTSCSINLSAPAAQRFGFNCKSNVFKATQSSRNG